VDAQHLLTYCQPRCPSQLSTSQEVPACSYNQSNSTHSWLLTISDLQRYPIINLFLLDSWIGLNLGTSIPPYNWRPEQTLVVAFQLIPILESTIGRKLHWIFKHCSSEKHVAPRGHENLVRIIVRNLLFKLSLFSRAWRRHECVHLCCFTQVIAVFCLDSSEWFKLHPNGSFAHYYLHLGDFVEIGSVVTCCESNQDGLGHHWLYTLKLPSWFPFPGYCIEKVLSIIMGAENLCTSKWYCLDSIWSSVKCIYPILSHFDFTESKIWNWVCDLKKLTDLKSSPNDSIFNLLLHHRSKWFKKE
jgi:hypothetical protein